MPANETNNQRRDTKGIIALVYRGLIPIMLLIGGLVLLALRIPGWSTIVGLPLTIIGAVFLIYEYDSLVTRRISPLPENLEHCSVCGRLTKPRKGESGEDVICPYCRYDLGQRKKHTGHSK